MISTKASTTEIVKALDFAKQAHGDQVRKYTGEPYWYHPLQVAKFVEYVGGNKFQIQASLLHDVVEDTNVTLDDIYREFGLLVRNLVEDLTDVARPEDGNRARRVEINRAHTAKADPQAQTIKLADLISNSLSIIEHDEEFARVYIKEKIELLKVLKKGNGLLYKYAVKMTNHYLQHKELWAPKKLLRATQV